MKITEHRNQENIIPFEEFLTFCCCSETSGNPYAIQNTMNTIRTENTQFCLQNNHSNLIKQIVQAVMKA